jgi:hypothetical protein
MSNRLNAGGPDVAKTSVDAALPIPQPILLTPPSLSLLLPCPVVASETRPQPSLIPACRSVCPCLGRAVAEVGMDGLWTDCGQSMDSIHSRNAHYVSSGAQNHVVECCWKLIELYKAVVVVVVACHDSVSADCSSASPSRGSPTA